MHSHGKVTGTWRGNGPCSLAATASPRNCSHAGLGLRLRCRRGNGRRLRLDARPRLRGRRGPGWPELANRNRAPQSRWLVLGWPGQSPSMRMPSSVCIVAISHTRRMPYGRYIRIQKLRRSYAVCLACSQSAIRRKHRQHHERTEHHQHHEIQMPDPDHAKGGVACSSGLHNHWSLLFLTMSSVHQEQYP